VCYYHCILAVHSLQLTVRPTEPCPSDYPHAHHCHRYHAGQEFMTTVSELRTTSNTGRNSSHELFTGYEWAPTVRGLPAEEEEV
ncbi:hypothetical protein BaRGS_00038728, partial [Batillaria attramentaria]